MASRRCMWTPPPDFSRSLPSRPSQKSTSTTKDKQQQHQQQTTTTSSSRTSSFTSTNNYDNYNGVQTLHVDSSIRFLSAFHPSDFSTITVIINIIININTNHIRNSNDNSGCNINQDNENLNENDRCHDQFEGCIMMVPMHARLIRPAFQGFIRTQPVFPLQKEQQHQRQKYKYKYLVFV